MSLQRLANSDSQAKSLHAVTAMQLVQGYWPEVGLLQRIVCWKSTPGKQSPPQRLETLTGVS